MAKKSSPGLSALGTKVEALLNALIADMERDVKEHKDGAGRRYTLVDQMRVIDRANKLESIKAKMDDDEGSYFDGDDDDKPEQPGGADDETG